MRKTCFRSICVLCAILLSGCAMQMNDENLSRASADTERIVLTLGYGKGRTYPEELIEYFNQSQDTYLIQGISYGEGSNEDRRKKLLQNIQEGNAPDIILVNAFGFNWAADHTQYFENLRPYIDASEDLAWDDFVPAFIQAYAPNGEIYHTVSAFSVETVAAKQGKDKISDLNISTIERLVQETGGAKNLQCWDKNFFGLLLDEATKRCVDFDQNTCDFSGNEFQQALELYAAFLQEDGAEESFHSNGRLYVDSVSSFSAVQFHETVFQAPVSYLGMPLTNQSLFYLSGDCFAMTADSRQKDGVWAFLERFFSSNYQVQHSTAFPTNMYALESRMESAKSGDMEPVTAPFDMEVTYTPASESEIEQITELINATETVSRTKTEETDVSVIVSRNISEYYVSNDLSITETIEHVQSDVEEYLSSR